MRAVGAAVAPEGTGGRCRGERALRRRCSVRRSPGGVWASSRISHVGVHARQHQHDGNDAANDTRAGAPFARAWHRLARDSGLLLTGPLNVYRLPLAIARGLDLERQKLADFRPATITRKGRDVHKDRITAARWRDETETAVVVPLVEFAVESH